MRAEWAGHGTYGINALLPGIPRLTGVAVPPDVTVLSELTSQAAALDQVPESGLPVVMVASYVSPLEQTVPAIAPFPPDGEVQVLFRYAARRQSTPQGVRDEGITLRAIWKCIPKLFLTPEGEALRQSVVTATSVQILNLVSMRELTVTTRQDDTTITGAVLAALRVRDLHASQA